MKGLKLTLDFGGQKVGLREVTAIIPGVTVKRLKYDTEFLIIRCKLFSGRD